MKNTLNASRKQHTDAVQSRIDSVGELKDVVDVTKSLFALSKVSLFLNMSIIFLMGYRKLQTMNQKLMN